MFKELFTEAKKVSTSIDWASEEKGLDKKLSKEYGIKIKDDGRMEASVSGDPKKIVKFLTSADYALDMDEVEDMFPELFESSDRMPKDIKKKLDGMKKVKTNKRTQSLWYQPNTEYEIESVADGFYDKKPGINTPGGFIPLKDLNV